MLFSILTLFPEMFASPFNYSIVKRAMEKKLIDINLINIRDFAKDKYKTVDDKPYGGGVGMIMKVDVIDRAIDQIKNSRTKIILLDPKGETYNQSKARKLSKYDHLILVCGHYEGVDARVETLVDEVISVGDYILTGGEIPAMVIVDSITRLIPGAINLQSPLEESFSQKNRLEAPQYTRPSEYKGMKVPEVLVSGNHKMIEEWKKTHGANKSDLPTGKSRI